MFHIGYDLRLMPAVKDSSEIPTTGKDLIIVATVGDSLYFRRFDSQGTMVTDTDERSLPKKSQKIDRLKKLLAELWPPHELTGRRPKTSSRL